MIKVKLTENYTGFNIEGTYDDLNELYDSISYVLDKEEYVSELEEDMKLHVLGFLYDVRHAYQGDRMIKAVDNDLTDELKEYYGIKKSVKQDILYSFDYLIPDIILDIILVKYFTCKKNSKNNYTNVSYNIVWAFYGKVINSLKEILTENQLKKVRKNLDSSLMTEKLYLSQWFTKISIDYIKMNKEKRKKEIMHVLNYIYNYHAYENFFDMKKEIEEYAKEHECKVTDLEYGNYPERIDW